VPAHVFKVKIGVGLGNNLAAQAGNRCLHGSILAIGCDTPKALVEQVFASNGGEGVFFCAHNAKYLVRTSVRSTLKPRWRPTDVTGAL
jgi:hypothetical protein